MSRSDIVSVIETRDFPTLDAIRCCVYPCFSESDA